MFKVNMIRLREPASQIEYHCGLCQRKAGGLAVYRCFQVETAADLIGLIPSVLMCAAVLWYLGRERSKETALRIWTKKWSGAEADPRP